jgi:hypothetical protein
MPVPARGVAAGNPLRGVNNALAYRTMDGDA